MKHGYNARCRIFLIVVVLAWWPAVLCLAQEHLPRHTKQIVTASESLDVGTDLGSTVSRDYYERRPFKFDGLIKKVTVELK